MRGERERERERIIKRKVERVRCHNHSSLVYNVGVSFAKKSTVKTKRKYKKSLVVNTYYWKYEMNRQFLFC